MCSVCLGSFFHLQENSREARSRGTRTWDPSFPALPFVCLGAHLGDQTPLSLLLRWGCRPHQRRSLLSRGHCRHRRQPAGRQKRTHLTGPPLSLLPWGAGSTNHNATCPQPEHLLSFLSFLLDCARCSPLHWWYDPNTERDLRRGSAGQAGGSANYDLAKACTPLNVAAPHHAHNLPFAFWVIKYSAIGERGYTDQRPGACANALL